MGVLELQSLDDSRLDVFERLTDLQLRSKVEPSRAIFIAETIEVIYRSLDAGNFPISMLTDKKFLPTLEVAISKAENLNPDFEVFTLPPDELEKLTGFSIHRGALCAFRRPPEKTPEEVLNGAEVVAVLEDIRDYTNVGAIFRSAAAMGADAVLVSPACYDPLYRRAIRVSMGTVFQVPWARIGTQKPNDWSDPGISLLHKLGFTVAAMALGDGSLPLNDPRIPMDGKIAMIFGTEGTGLSPRTISRCDLSVKIPMKHGVDSLNVAASSAVALWEVMRARG
ncbi:MAG: TrmH family RNA methyltransferase [Coriobacteriales bacterium]|jgi:tRNA G18 (ribose-2'-O)-methylase SpoU